VVGIAGTRELWNGSTPRFFGGPFLDRLLNSPRVNEAFSICWPRGGMDLAVVEIKASQDIHLPLQALDYWMRVKWHLERGEFAGRGYFPGLELRPEPPVLLLIAPALEFHPTNEGILRYFSPEIEVERIGLGIQWRQELRVMFRRSGACSQFNAKLDRRSEI
jgi:hypothetical protein